MRVLMPEEFITTERPIIRLYVLISKKLQGEVRELRVRDLAKDMGVSTRRVWELIKQLVKKRYIYRKKSKPELLIDPISGERIWRSKSAKYSLHPIIDAKTPIHSLEHQQVTAKKIDQKFEEKSPQLDVPLGSEQVNLETALFGGIAHKDLTSLYIRLALDTHVYLKSTLKTEKQLLESFPWHQSPQRWR